MKITKQIEWDMGHRVTNHNSKCRNLHGHRYKAEICVEGEIVRVKNISEEGMVLDFGDIKTFAMKSVHDMLDHGFMIWDKDTILVRFFQSNPSLKYIIVPFTPTAENISEWIFKTLHGQIKDTYHTKLALYSIKVWETPTSYAEYALSDYTK